jgi:hypothetical protein
MTYSISVFRLQIYCVKKSLIHTRKQVPAKVQQLNIAMVTKSFHKGSFVYLFQ